MNENPPVLRVVAGRPTDEELAALTVVIHALTNARDDAAPQVRLRKVAWTREFDYLQTASSWRAS